MSQKTCLSRHCFRCFGAKYHGTPSGDCPESVPILAAEVVSPSPCRQKGLGLMSPRFRNRSRRPRQLFMEQLEDRCVPANVVPVITALHADLTSPSSSMVQLTGTFTDPEANDPHAVIIDWADGTSPTKTTLAVG